MSDAKREAFEKAYHKETGLYASYAPNKKGYTDVIAEMCYRIWQAALQSGEPVADVNQQLVEALLLFVQNSSVQALVPVTCEIAEEALLSAGKGGES